MDGRGAAVLGQQRRVHVDKAETRHLKYLVSEDLAVCRDHAKVGLERSKGCEKALISQPLWLENRQSMLQGELLDWPRLRFVSPPARAIGLRHNADHRVSRLTQRLKSGNGEIGGAEVDDAKGRRRSSPFARAGELANFLDDEIPLDAAYTIEE